MNTATASTSDLVSAALLLEDVERRLPGWGFLLRNDRRNGSGYFCNIMSPDFEGAVTLSPNRPPVTSHTGSKAPAYGATAVEAVKAAIAQIDPIFFEEA